MERAMISAVTLLCVLLCEEQKVFGTEVNMRVKPGESVTLYCDCAVSFGSHIHWMRNCSHENQPSLVIDPSYMFLETLPRFSFVPNSSSNSYNLHIENVSVSDEGLYYCRINERNARTSSEYKNGNYTTRLSVFGSVSPHMENINITSRLPASDCRLCFILLFIVCSVCVLLFSIGLYCLCHKKTAVSASTQTENGYYENEAEVCYASLNTPSMLKKKEVQRSDFSIYTEVQTNRK
ncbi:uncharacterized protein LOC130216325 [Danio aesculapii]|uniref:uncharacterized protein LOC130216325 n=1 Tax=Danio aesculapii TaxID=1142201 RepID=UPI0024BFC2B7|nr:uncharacterized protein LOC130216325 [Danio aesculapii]